MSKIIVIVDTDHLDSDEAIKSVSNSLKRAGYVFSDYQTGAFTVTDETVFNRSQAITSRGEGLLQFVEPEVIDRAEARS